MISTLRPPRPRYITGPDNLPAEPTDDDLASIGTVQCALLQSQSTSGSSTSGSTTVFAPDMRYAPMTAAALGVDKDDAEDVSLVFNPAFTAIEVNMTSDEELTINKVELSSTGTDYLSGVYFLKAGSDISASGAVTVSDTRRFNTVSLSGLNQQVSQDAGINFTLFTIPKVNTGVITLSVQTQTGSGNTLSTATAHLPLKYSNGSVLQFQPGKKYRINALKLSDSWKIFFAVGVDEWVELDPVNIGIE